MYKCFTAYLLWMLKTIFCGVLWSIFYSFWIQIWLCLLHPHIFLNLFVCCPFVFSFSSASEASVYTFLLLAIVSIDTHFFLAYHCDCIIDNGFTYLAKKSDWLWLFWLQYTMQLVLQHMNCLTMWTLTSGSRISFLENYKSVTTGIASMFLIFFCDEHCRIFVHFCSKWYGITAN